ncbi:MAG: TonB-dependent receptor [Alistipes sp.]|nr:TonB-dependent receptor [Alistipes sp.]
MASGLFVFVCLGGGILDASASDIQLFNAETQSRISVNGKVIDSNGQPLVGVTVVEVGNEVNGSMTDLDGAFKLTVASGAELSLSYIGYKTTTVTASAGEMSITLEDDTVSIDDVVVVGFGVQKKSDLTGAVAQVSMDKVLGDRPVINASAALQGAIPGLMVSGSSSPGQAKSFNIRGTLSLNGGSPLILIDNVEGDISSLNPDDIESVTVMKDASSAAIYGARAAGGVILITTKRPKDDAKFSLDYSFNQGWENALLIPKQAPLLDYIDAYEEAGFSQQYWAGNGDVGTWRELIHKYRAGELDGVYDNGIYKHTDGRTYYLKEGNPQRAALGTGHLSNHNLSVSGGTDRIRFRISGNYSYENGPMVTSKDSYTRKAVSAFISGDITKWFTQEASMFYTNTQRSALSSSIRDPFATRLISWYPEGYMPAEILGTDHDYILDSPRNSYMVSPTSKTTTSLPRMQLKSIFKPMKNWDIILEYTYNQNNYEYKNYTGVLEYADVQLALKTLPLDPTLDTYTINHRTTKYNALNLYTNYNLDLGKHHVGIMLGFNQESSWRGNLNTWIQGQSVTTVPSFGGGTGEKGLTDSYYEYSIRGGFGRITYNYDDRYLLTVNGRYDGSSKFPKKQRFGFFPSVSVGWRIGQEKFMEKTRAWLDELKLRASYGSIGNQLYLDSDPFYGAYGYVAEMALSESTVWLDNDGKVQSMSTPGLVRGNYGWEVVNTLDIGLDFGFLSNRLTGSFDWYRRDTKGMLAAGSEIPSTVGASAPLQNVADMRSNGWELSINWRDQIGDWRYYVGFNLYDHKTFVTKYNNLSGDLSQWAAGDHLNEIYGLQFDGYYSIDDFDLDQARQKVWVLKEGVTSIQGVNVKPGDVKYKDLDGDHVITSGEWTKDNHGDWSIIGNSTSRYQFGANLGVGWKGIDLGIVLQGVGKRDVTLSNKNALYPFGAAGADGVFQAVYYNQTDYWRAKSYDPNSEDYMVAVKDNPKLFRIYDQMENSGSNTQTNTRNLQNGAYMRVKNITLSYTFPKKWMSKIYVQQFRIYASVENLTTVTSLPLGYDPENLQWAYPFYRTWSIGANITF